MIPRIIEEVRTSAPPYWLTRVVPNKFPILEAEGTRLGASRGTGYGIHEVIIETPSHGADLPDLSMTELEAVIATWHRRFEEALRRPGIEAVLVFKNRGSVAGASLEHSHSQLVAMAHVPPRLARTLKWACARYEEDQRCATCKEIAMECGTGDRVVQVNDAFAVLVPYAARHPFEQWIVPRRHAPSFGQASSEELIALAGTVQRALRRLDAVAGEVAYNLVIEPGSNDSAQAHAAHWSVRIVPDLITPGGFEMLSGLAVNPSTPEVDARRLRDCRIGCI